MVKAGMLAAFEMGLANGTARIFVSLPVKAPSQENAELSLWRARQDARAIFALHGGDPKFLDEAMRRAGRASSSTNEYGYNGKGELRRIIGEKAFVQEVEAPLLAMDRDPGAISVSDALAAVAGIVHAWATLEGAVNILQEMERSGLGGEKANAELAERKSTTPSKEKEGGLNWKWIGGIGAVLLGGYLWNAYQKEKAGWESENSMLSKKVEYLEKKVKRLKKERKERETTSRDWYIEDRMKDAAIGNVVEVLTRKRGKSE